MRLVIYVVALSVMTALCFPMYLILRVEERIKGN